MWWSPSARCYSMSRRRVYGNRQRNNIAQVSALTQVIYRCYAQMVCAQNYKTNSCARTKSTGGKQSAEQHMQTRRAASRLLGCVVNPFFVRPRSQCFIISQIDRARGAACFWYKLRGSIAKSHNNIYNKKKEEHAHRAVREHQFLGVVYDCASAHINLCCVAD